MFWGLTIKEYRAKDCRENRILPVPRAVERPFHVSRATLDWVNNFSIKAQVYAITNVGTFNICNLWSSGSNDTSGPDACLDLNFSVGEMVAFYTSSKRDMNQCEVGPAVCLTGYYLK